MGRILRSMDGLASEGFIVEPDVTKEENERYIRKINEQIPAWKEHILKEFNEQSEFGVKYLREYIELQLSKNPTNPDAYLVEVTEEERKKIIYKDYFDLKFPNKSELFDSLTEKELIKMLFAA